MMHYELTDKEYQDNLKFATDLFIAEFDKLNISNNVKEHLKVFLNKPEFITRLVEISLSFDFETNTDDISGYVAYNIGNMLRYKIQAYFEHIDISATTIDMNDLYLEINVPEEYEDKGLAFIREIENKIKNNAGEYIFGTNTFCIWNKNSKIYIDKIPNNEYCELPTP